MKNAFISHRNFWYFSRLLHRFVQQICPITLIPGKKIIPPSLIQIQEWRAAGMYALIGKMLPSHNSFCAKFFWGGMECKNIELSGVQYLLLLNGPPGCYDILTRSCISYNAEKYHLSEYLLPQFPVTIIQVVSPRLRISTTILSLGSHSPPGRSHLPLWLLATWWQLAITLLLLRPPAPPESQVMRWLWFPEPSQGRWNAVFHCHR